MIPPLHPCRECGEQTDASDHLCLLCWQGVPEQERRAMAAAADLEQLRERIQVAVSRRLHGAAT